MVTLWEKSWYRKCLSTHVLVEFKDCYPSMVSSPSIHALLATMNNFITSLEAQNIVVHAVSFN